ncbi:MAG: aromatic-ring-hydroxylating dioxygenase subunit beta [Rhodospirillales bacterium]|nr:aromatic-ring-hydroxylating dioxygenase subunit beta [Rhodospirillales bacterium]
MNDKPFDQPVGADLFLEIQRFLADEAALLDRWAYREWIALLTDDITYRVTTRLVRHREDGVQDHEIIDEDMNALRLRADQLADPKLTRAENPPSFYRRFISNIRADQGEHPDSFLVGANVLVYRNRPSNNDIEIYAGERLDVLRRVDGRIRIAERLVRLDQSVLDGGTLNTLL